MASRYGVQAFSWMLALAVSSGFVVQPAQAQNEASGEKVYQRTLRSTVWILVPKGGRTSSGTGSLIDASRGHVITNYHVVGEADQVIVLFPVFRKGELVTERGDYLATVKSGGGVRGEVLYKDPRHDLALIKLKAVPKGAQVVHLAPKSAGPGQRVHSIGNPGRSGALWLYTSGTVRQVYHKQWRVKESQGKTYEFDAQVVETQSPTNPGDSGGPLVNDRGELVAITQGTAMDAQLLSLFIDVKEVRDFLKQKQALPRYSSAVARNGSEEKPKDPADTTALTDSSEDLEHRAATSLSFAKTLADDGKLEKAKERCEKIIKSYPKTKAAEEAKVLLDKLSK